MFPVIYPRLPVADLDRSTGFYLELGFSLDQQLSTSERSAMTVSAAIVLMLVRETPESSIHLALAFPTRADVDDILSACVPGGGTVTSRARKRRGGNYSGTAADPDGHRWEFLCLEDGT